METREFALGMLTATLIVFIAWLILLAIGVTPNFGLLVGPVLWSVVVLLKVYYDE